MFEQDKVVRHGQICEYLNQMYEAKNKDYGDSFVKTRKKYANAILIRLEDKMNRLDTLIDKGHTALVKDESIDDTLLDIANYCIMEVMERRMDNERNLKGLLNDENN